MPCVAAAAAAVAVAALLLLLVRGWMALAHLQRATLIQTPNLSRLPAVLLVHVAHRCGTVACNHRNSSNSSNRSSRRQGCLLWASASLRAWPLRWRRQRRMAVVVVVVAIAAHWLDWVSMRHRATMTDADWQLNSDTTLPPTTFGVPLSPRPDFNTGIGKYYHIWLC